MALPKSWRIVKEKDIQLVFKKGFRFESKFLRLRLLKTNLDHTRVLVVVSKKIHKKAVFRNKVKRRVLGIFEKWKAKNKIGIGVDIMIMVKDKSILKKTFLEILTDLVPAYKFSLSKIFRVKS